MLQTDFSSVSQAVRDRYTDGKQGSNTTDHQGVFGTYITDHDSPELSYVLPTITPDQIHDLVAEVASQFDSATVRVYLDGQTADRELHGPLQTAGCKINCELVYLAYRGLTPRNTENQNVSIEAMSKENATDYYTVWCKGFSDSEQDPNPEEMEDDVASLIQDVEAGNGGLVGRVDGDAAAIAGWYEGTDRLIFHLATRVPYRNQGLAKSLLTHIVNESCESGCRSVSIFTDLNDTPVAFYRRMGFTEEVYRQIRYTLTL
jgi:ribosomal protein S18 acetylase RimI-like enzyme